MKGKVTDFNCADREVRPFSSVTEMLLEFGFDPTLLTKDDNLVKLGLRPGAGFFSIISHLRTGQLWLIDDHFSHYSKKSRKSAPASISARKLLNDISFVAFLPSVFVEKDTELTLRMSTITFFARLITKVWRKTFGPKKLIPIFNSFLVGISPEDFKVNYGYRYIGLSYSEDLVSTFLVLEDENNQNQFFVSLSALGYTDKVFACYK